MKHDARALVVSFTTPSLQPPVPPNPSPHHLFEVGMVSQRDHPEIRDALGDVLRALLGDHPWYEPQATLSQRTWAGTGLEPTERALPPHTTAEQGTRMRGQAAAPSRRHLVPR